MHNFVALDLFDKVIQKCRTDIIKYQAEPNNLFVFVLMWILEKNQLFNAQNQIQKNQDEICSYLLKKVQLMSAKRNKHEATKQAERDCINTKQGKQRFQQGVMQGQNSIQNGCAVEQIGCIQTIAEPPTQDYTQDISNSQLQNTIINNTSKHSIKDSNQRNPIPSQTLEESCIIFSENMIHKRMALSLSRDEDYQAVQIGNQSKVTIRNTLSNNEQLKLAIEREQVYEQNLKLLKQSPNTQVQSWEFQQPHQPFNLNQNANIIQQTTRQSENNKKDIKVSPQVESSSQASPKIDFMPIIQINPNLKDQGNNYLKNQEQNDRLMQHYYNKTVNLNSTPSPPLLPSTTIPQTLTIPIINNPQLQSIQYQQNAFNINNMYTQYPNIINNNNNNNNYNNNIENIPNFKLTPNRVSNNPPQLPTINTNIISNSFSASSNLSSHRSSTPSNGNMQHQQQTQIQQYPANQLNQEHYKNIDHKKQLNDIFQQYSHHISPNLQQYYNTQSPDNSLAQYNIITYKYPQSSPPPSHNSSEYLTQQKDNFNIQTSPQQVFHKTTFQGEVSPSLNFVPFLSSQIPQTNQKEEPFSSDGQRYNNSTNINLVKVNSIEIENINHNNINNITNNNNNNNVINNNIIDSTTNQSQNSTKKYYSKSKSNKLPSDDTYKYIQTLFEIGEIKDGQGLQTMILFDSNNAPYTSNQVERERMIEDGTAASFSSLSSTSSTSLKHIKSLGSAIDDDNIMAEKSKQKLKEKQLLYLNKEFSQAKKVQSIELNDDPHSLQADSNNQTCSYTRQKNKLNTFSESGEANPVFANLTSKKRLSLILQQSLILKNEEFQQQCLASKNVEYDTCSSLDINQQ